MPVSPWFSCRLPTRTVRFTVVVGFESSGASSTCSPLGRAYSVMPSTLRTGAAAAALAALAGT